MSLKIALQDRRLIRNILNRNFFINIFLIVIFAFLIFFSIKRIEIDSGIMSLFPSDKKLKITLSVAQNSANAKKVIVYVKAKDESSLLNVIKDINSELANSDIKFVSAIPTTEQFLKLYQYIEKNSILLYPYEVNPFIESEINKRLKAKYDYISSSPFLDTSDSFLYDPLFFTPEIISLLKEISSGKYTPREGGLFSDDNSSYIKILNVDFGNEEYQKIVKLKKIDEKIKKVASLKKAEAFLFSSHLYFLESKSRITFELSIIFTLTTIFMCLIFYLFFRKLSLALFAAMPIIGGYAITFLILSFVRSKFGGIAFAFGATIMGISIDYIIHYLTKRDLYSSLKEVRDRISSSLFMGFITTLAGFIFLLFSQTEALFEITIFGAISISSVFLLSFFVLQPLLPPTGSKKDKQSIVIKIPFFNSKALFYIWILITLLLILFLPFIKFEDNIMNLDMKHKELDRRKELVANSFKESNDNIFLLFTGESREEMLTRSFKSLMLVREHSQGKNSFITPAIITPPESILKERRDFIKKYFNKELFLNSLNKSEFNIDSFNDWLSMVKHIDSVKLEPLSDDIKTLLYDPYFTKIEDKEYLMIHIYNRELAKTIQDILMSNNVDFQIVDIVEDTKDKLVKFEKNALLLVSFSLVLIFVILFIYFKNLVYSFTALLPAVTALLACIATSYFTNNGFNLMHFVVAVLVLGIGVDYGIFVTIAYKATFKKEELEHTFQSIIICALTTLSCFGVLAISANYSISSIGSSMFTAMSMALFTAIYALPYILKKDKKV